MGRLITLVFLGAAVLAGGVVLPAEGDSHDPIAFDDTTTLALKPGGQIHAALVLNQTNDPRRIRVSVDGASGQIDRSASAISLDKVSEGSDTALPITKLDQPIGTVVPAGGSLSVSLRPMSAGKVFLTVIDLSSGLTIRRLVDVAPPGIGKPAVTTWKPPRPRWKQNNDSIGILPLAAGGTCGDPTAAPISATLVSGDDSLPVSASCAAAGLVVTAATLASADPGTYAGTVKVGDTDVAVELLKADSPWKALASLGAGILAALVLRSLGGRRAIWVMRRRIDQLPTAVTLEAPGLADCLERWTVRASDEFRDTTEALNNSCSSEKLWASWQRGNLILLRYMFVPSPAAMTTLEQCEKARAQASAELTSWNSRAIDLLTALSATPLLQALPPTLANRASVILSDPDRAMQEPVEPPPGASVQRSRSTGLVAVLDEVSALLAAAELERRLTRLADQLARSTTFGAVADSSVAQVIRRAWLQTYADARLSVNALRHELARTLDARALMTDGFEPRARAAAQQVDRLYTRAPSGLHFAVQPDDVGEVVDGHGWPSWASLHLRQAGAVVQRVAARYSVLITDIASVIMAVIVVLAAGMSTLYFGKAWGSPGDVSTAVLAALAGTLALAPVFAAIDALGRGPQLEKGSSASAT